MLYHRLLPLALGGLLEVHGLLALRAGANVVHRPAGAVLDEADEGHRLRRELGGALVHLPVGLVEVDGAALVEELRAPHGGELVDGGLAVLVEHGHRQLLGVAGDVHLGQVPLPDAQVNAVVQEQEVVPPAGARPAGRRTVLVPLIPELVVVDKVHAGGEGPLAHAGAVGPLHHPDDTLDELGVEAESLDGAARGAGRAGDERVGAVPVVQADGLCTLHEDVLAVLFGLLDEAQAIDQVGLAVVRQRLHLFCPLLDLAVVEGHTIDPVQDHTVLVHELGGRLAEALRVQHEPGAQASAVRHVSVARAHAALGGADDTAGAGLGVLARGVQELGGAHDEADAAAHLDAAVVHVQAQVREVRELLPERPGCHHHVAAQEADLALVRHPRGDDVGDELLAVNHDGVSGVGAAVEAGHDVGPVSVAVNYLAFAFVAPLGADDHDAGHVAPPSFAVVKRYINARKTRALTTKFL